MAVPTQITAIQPYAEDLGATLVKPYAINDQMVDRTLELKHGKSTKVFNMDKVSNSDFDLVGPMFALFSMDFQSDLRKSLNVLTKCVSLMM